MEVSHKLLSGWYSPITLILEINMNGSFLRRNSFARALIFATVLSVSSQPAPAQFRTLSDSGVKNLTLNSQATAAAAAIKELRSSYVKGELEQYRRYVFFTHIAMRHMSGSAVARFTEEVVASARKDGGDGLETILIAGADAVAQRSDVVAKKRLKLAFAGLKGKIRYAFSAGPNFLVPMTSASSFLALDLRPDAVRAILDVILARSSRGRYSGGLLDVLSGADSQKALCNLPAMTMPDGSTAPPDANRKANCDSTGAAGGTGGGTVPNAVGDLAAGGCLLASPGELEQMAERLENMQQCMAEMIDNPGNPFGVGWASAVTSAVFIGVILYEYEYGYRIPLAAAAAEREKFNTEVKTAANAKANVGKTADAATTAENKVSAKTNELKEATQRADELKAAWEQLADAGVDPNSAEWQSAKINYELAESVRSRVEGELKTATEERDAAKTAAEAAKTLAAKLAAELAAKPKPEGSSLDPGDAYKSAHCDKAFGGVTERLKRERIGADWSEWTSRLRRVGRWSSDQTTPYDSLGLQVCGLDSTTNQTAHAKCPAPVLCTEGSPDATCGCKGPPGLMTRLLEKMTVTSCSKTRCDGSAATATARGLVCDCSDAKPDDVDPSSPLPIPSIINDMMGTLNSSAATTRPETAAAVRSVFDGKPHKPVARR